MGTTYAQYSRTWKNEKNEKTKKLKKRKTQKNENFGLGVYLITINALGTWICLRRKICSILICFIAKIFERI